MNENSLFDRFGIRPNVRSNGNLELRMRCLVHFIRGFGVELRSKTGLSWKQRFRAWKSGFSSRSWMIYELDRNDPDLYLADFKALLNSYRINGFYNPVIGNKLLLSRLLSVHGVPHPDVVYTILGGKLYEEGSGYAPSLPEALCRTLETYPRQVFRPVLSGSGEGIFFLDREEGSLRLNGENTTLEEVCELLAGLDRYVVTEFVEQADYARKIYSGSTNTLRILTLWDGDTHSPYIAGVVHRFGSRNSGPTDHWDKGQGGYCTAVDLETGTLGQAVSLSKDSRLCWTASHPDSGEAFEGVAIPGFDNCIEGVLEAAGHFPYCPSIGWDVVMTEKGFSILEANTIQGLAVMQVHVPLLRDPRTRAFYRRWGMA